MPTTRNASTMFLAAWIVLPTALAAQRPPSRWTLGGTPAAGYSMTTTSGSATDRAGATLGLRADTAPTSAFGSISSGVVADTFRLRRVRLIADIDTKNVTGGASPWLRVDGPSGQLAFDNGADQAIKGTSSGHREITLCAAAEHEL